MSQTQTRRGRGVEPPPAQDQATKIFDDGLPRRWRVAIVMTVFEGYAWLTEDDAYKLQDKLSAMESVTGQVFLRASQPQLATDYTDVESVVADIELAIPARPKPDDDPQAVIIANWDGRTPRQDPDNISNPSDFDVAE